MAKRKIKKVDNTEIMRSKAMHNYENVDIPRSFVVSHGTVNPNVRTLIAEFKRIMKPNTAERLKARKKGKIIDYVKMSSTLKVNNLIMFSQNHDHIGLKIGRLPQGPTLCFQVMDYTLMKDVISVQKRAMVTSKLFAHPPCLVTNIHPEEGENHMQLCGKMFSDMFPEINPTKVKTSQFKRCCLINYDEEESLVYIRNYAILTKPVGISKATKKILGSAIPNLGKFNEISDFVLKSEILSDSEGEDDADNHVTIDKKRKGSIHKQKSAIKLTEIGPRLTLKLMKVETGICDGSVLFHDYIHKSSGDILKIEKKLKAKRRLLKERQKEQSENIKKKEKAKDSHRTECLKGMGIDPSFTRDLASDDDDKEYFRQEIGEDPDEDVFKHSGMKMKYPNKKFKK